MKFLLPMFILISLSVFLLCTNLTHEDNNPLLADFKTPYGTPPFELIKTEHFKPAFLKAMEEQHLNVEKIIHTEAKPTFENTIEKLESSGRLLEKVESVFDLMNNSMINDTIQKIAQDISPLLSQHHDHIILNDRLFKRIKAVVDNRENFNLTSEQNRLLDEYYKTFIRNGAALEESKKEKLTKINEELSVLELKFGNNVLKEINNFQLIIDNPEDLAGLNENIIQAAAETAKDNGHEGKWMFTIQKPSMIPFLTYADNRELRKKIYQAYTNKGDHNNEYDNKKILLKMANLRDQRAKLLGYETHAHYVLEENMAKTPDNVYQLLNQIWEPAIKVAKEEVKKMQALIDAEGGNFKLEPSDWWYYSEKVRKNEYGFDEAALKPYFQLENVRKGAFDVANKLWGLKFVEKMDLPKYHEDVSTFEVIDKNDSLIGILYTDYFPRSSKRGGAWMSSIRKQYYENGKKVIPIITNNGNFTKPTGDQPALLTFDEVTTLFHEFGHALHGLLSNCQYHTLSGTSVPRDFVELPSQIMENWAGEEEVLKMYAKHYQTGETIPNDLIEKMKNAATFNQGFKTVEYLAASFLDMDWHTHPMNNEIDVNQFEDQSMDEIGLIQEIIPRYRSTYFRHIFAGGYSAGYYSYIWSEVLDSDAFAYFKEKGIFDPETAKSYRKNILEQGNTEDPMILYKKFRGQEPETKALLKKRGLS